MPGNSRPLQAFITPEDPRDEPNPTAFIWPARGDEKRQTSPRIGADPSNLKEAGWKELHHDVEVFLTWFNDDEDEQSDTSFPAVIDVVMLTLRGGIGLTAADPAVVYDPLTGMGSQLIDVGENMSYQFAGVRSTADQRWLRYDALITVTIIEEFQS